MYRKSFVISLFIFTLASVVKSDPKCYCVTKGIVYAPCGYGTAAVPCGQPNSAGYSSCCAAGDICGTDGFCHFTHEQGFTSGYYIGGCTDPLFLDSSCGHHCSQLGFQDVVYNKITGLWSCCFRENDILNCANPNPNGTFAGASPQAIFASASGPLSTPSSSTLTTSTTSLTSQLIPSTQSTTGVSSSSASLSSSTFSSAAFATPSVSAVSENQSSELSTGAKAGIGVGVALAVVLGAVAAYVVLTLIRRKWHHKEETRRYTPAELPDKREKHVYVAESELPNNVPATKTRVGELSAQSPVGRRYDPMELE